MSHAQSVTLNLIDHLQGRFLSSAHPPLLQDLFIVSHAQNVTLNLIDHLQGHFLSSSHPPLLQDLFIVSHAHSVTLNLIDLSAGSSAVISAPTSSGKTFIASYVIACVLKASKDGRVAIVLPTRVDVGINKPFRRSFSLRSTSSRTAAYVAAVQLPVAIRSWIQISWPQVLRRYAVKSPRVAAGASLSAKGQ